jgi:hypothetical protein
LCFFLQKFKDIFPDEIPSGSPPVKAIEHHIYLISNLVIPNRLAYRSNPEKIRELQRQVEKLILKGYIYESMSSCVVPIFLIHKKDGAWRMCVYCRAINNITVNYRYFIFRLNGMLDELHGSCLFSKIYLKSWILLY